MAIEIIPAIDIIGGECVRLSQGDYGKVTKYSTSPLQIAKEYEALGVKRLHVVDLDGAKMAKPQNLHILEQITSATSLKVQYGGGIKDRESLSALFDCGAEWAICGSIAVNNPTMFAEWLEEFGSDHVLLGADVKDGMVATHGWLETSSVSLDQIITTFMRSGMKQMITTDISKDGMLCGPSFELYATLQERFPEVEVIVSGGISSMKDIEKLDKMGLSKVIAGKAIYEGKITYKEIEKWLQRE